LHADRNLVIYHYSGSLAATAAVAAAGMLFDSQQLHPLLQYRRNWGELRRLQRARLLLHTPLPPAEQTIPTPNRFWPARRT